MTLSGAVGTFTDANSFATPTEFKATINWGDGTTSTGTVTEGTNGLFSVNGSHNYANDQAYTIKATVTDEGGSTTTITSRAVIYANDSATQGLVNAVSTTHSWISEPSDTLNGDIQSVQFSSPQIDPLHSLMLANFNATTDLTGLHINNVASGSYSVTIHVNSGLLNFTSLSGLQNLTFTQTPTGHGLGTLTFTGSLSDINLALSRLTYFSQLTFSNSYSMISEDQLQITVSNGHGTVYDLETLDLLVA